MTDIGVHRALYRVSGRVLLLAGLLILSAFFGLTAWATRWVQIGEEVLTGISHFVDIDSLYQQYNHGDVLYWEKIEHPSQKPFIWQGKKVAYSLYQQGEDCTTGKSITPFQVVLYDSQGQVIASRNFNSQNRLTPEPDSFGDIRHQFVCNQWNTPVKPNKTPNTQPTPTSQSLPAKSNPSSPSSKGIKH